METTKDHIIKSGSMIDGADIHLPIPATTPEMVGHYRDYLRLNHMDVNLLITPKFSSLGCHLKADPEADPFVMQFIYPIRQTGQIAYLTLLDGKVEWRYHDSLIRYPQCPVLSDPIRMRWLDGLFAAFYLEAELPGSLDGALELLGPWDRVRWVKTNLFEGGRPGETLSDEIDLRVFDLAWDHREPSFLDWVADGLHKDRKRFRRTTFPSGGVGADFYLLRYNGRRAVANPMGQRNPIRYLAGVVNTVLQPEYQLRRFRDARLGKDGILMPLTRKDWQTLTDTYGEMAIEARFDTIDAIPCFFEGRKP